MYAKADYSYSACLKAMTGKNWVGTSKGLESSQ